MNPVAIYDITRAALYAVRDALNDVLPAEFRHQRVTVVNGPPAIDGWPDDGCVEHLVAWAETITATTAFPVPDGAAILCAPPSGALQVVVQSIRCEPTIEDNAFPHPADLDLAARLLSVEAAVAWKALTEFALSNPFGADCLLAGGQAVPPQGAVAGWETRLVVEAEFCGDPLADLALPDGFLTD